jgi:formamidopyrimidine-DNA glycosylase
MPELPEVETIARILNPLIAGKKIADIRVLRPKNILTGAEEFVASLTGETFLEVTRKGKFLLFHLTRGQVVVSHLRMEGKYYEAKAGCLPSKHDILIYDFADGSALRYNDVRKFGVLLLKSETDALSTPPVAALGPEPWDLTPQKLLKGLRQKKKKPIKEALLDQTLVSGLGNIYADEVLFAAKINPKTPAREITLPQCETLLQESRRILELAIANGGSTIRSYHAKEGLTGKMQNNLLAYGRGNQPCSRCGFPLRKIALGGRGTVYCPACQPLAGRPLLVGVTGPIASGKSAVAAYLAKKGYLRVDADAIVRSLYGKEEIRKAISALFGPKALKDGKVDKSYLLDLVSRSPQAKKALEAYVHPLVFAAIEKKIEATQAKRVVMDVPLLIGSPLQKECDLIITILASKKAQEARLSARGVDPQKSLALNRGWPQGAAKKAAGIVLDGSGDLPNLEKQLEAYKFL